MTPDTVVTLTALESFIWRIQQDAYLRGKLEMQSKVDSLRFLLHQSQRPLLSLDYLILAIIVGASFGVLLYSLMTYWRPR